LSKFTITGDANDVCARLKANLDAQDASFKANLGAMFKSPPPRAAATPAATPATAQATSGGWSLATKRNGGSARSRLRT
jgi:hypothetical protein